MMMYRALSLTEFTDYIIVNTWVTAHLFTFLLLFQILLLLEVEKSVAHGMITQA